MMKKTKQILSILLILYIIINLIFGNISFAVNQTTTNDFNSIDSNTYPQIKEMIQELKNQYPNWNFEILYTDINWTDAIANEYVGHGSSPRNLVPANNINYDRDWICNVCGEQTYDSGKWYCASEAAIAYMMDPRNSLNYSDIFQFMQLSYTDCNYERIYAMVEGTFLQNSVNVIIDSAQKYDVNAYYIVARLLQEQGKNGSTLTAGNGYNGQYEGYYNAFNIGANGNGKENVILNGLATAQSYEWTSLDSSIIGGTEIIAKRYIARGQNTLYFQKFDVENSDGNLYWHQYMQNILAAQKEGQTLRNTFEDIDAINASYMFIIPVYKNMPLSASQRPSSTSSPSNPVNPDTPTTSDMVRVNVTGSLYLREEPSKNSEKIDKVYKDEIVTRLVKATEKVDGTYWDYVMKANGSRGYAARETYDTEPNYKLYLVPVEDENPSTPEVPDDEAVIRNDKVKINTVTNNVTTVPGATVQDFSNLIGKDVTAKNSNGDVLNTDAKLSTGFVINDEYTVAVLGDVNGDGETTALDAAIILRYTVNQYNMTEVQKNAGDLANSNNPTALDAAKILRYTVGQYNINI